MNLGRKRAKHIDKEKKKFIYLTPCCLHTFSPYTTTCSARFRLSLLQTIVWDAAPIYHFFWSSALVFVKTHIKHFNDQMMKHGERKERICFSPDPLCGRSSSLLLGAAKAPLSSSYISSVMELESVLPSSQVCSSIPTDTLSPSRPWVGFGLWVPLSHH
jgi:hypothetical protein